MKGFVITDAEQAKIPTEGTLFIETNVEVEFSVSHPIEEGMSSQKRLLLLLEVSSAHPKLGVY